MKGQVLMEASIRIGRLGIGRESSTWVLLDAKYFSVIWWSSVHPVRLSMWEARGHRGGHRRLPYHDGIAGWLGQQGERESRTDSQMRFERHGC
jgi:hypothetical protein